VQTVAVEDLQETLPVWIAGLVHWENRFWDASRHG
jgi:hypothetical protein